MDDPLKRAIMDKLDPFTLAGEDLEEALFAGAPRPLSPREALKIADWLENDAPDVWEGDEARYDQFAAIIREVVRRMAAAR